MLVALAITLLWTIPAGVAIGTNARLARFLQPVVQVVAAIPATAIFPVLLLVLLQAPGGLNLAAVLLMLLGTQWYLLFNIIAGSSAIPQDLKFSTDTAATLTPGPLADADPAGAVSLHHHRARSPPAAAPGMPASWLSRCSSADRLTPSWVLAR